ncbi:mandelate racemase/muconate lactonizing enzyme family protein [Bordetella petrii]|uniref:mandelate racemase/muconate lactonizing enzyme family protein n=1 Tax=Bordetella petrii TaxID=94624 RepID=UPI00373418C5
MDDPVAVANDSRVIEVSLHGVGATPRSNWLFLKLAMDDGHVGWGELSLRGHEAILDAILQRLIPAIEDQTLDSLRGMRAAFPGLPCGRAGNAVLSALDQACTDLAGQYRGVPIHRLWGAAGRHPLPAYATVNRSIRERTPAGFADACKAAVDAGFKGVKVMPLDAVTPATAGSESGRREVRAAVQRLAAVRAAIGSEVSLMADCHWRLDEKTARDFLDAAAELRLHWLECPVPESHEWHEAIARLRQYANQRGVLLAGAENVVGASGAAPFIVGGLYDVVMPDIKYCGGYAEFARIASLAARHGVAVSPHNPSGPVAHAHTIHVCAALGVTQPVEQQFAESALFDACVAGEPAPFLAGAFLPPAGPGLGIAVDPVVVQANPAGESAISMRDPSFA